MMAAKFYDGASIKSTRMLSQQGKSPAVQSNSMKGLPGFIKTGQDKSSGGLVDGKGIGPHREGPIGKRGGSGNPDMDAGKFRGSSDKSYRATSTGPAGRIASNKGEPEKRGSSEKEGPARGKPKSGFHQSVSRGHPGRMESLRGRAKTSWER
jgi:hypothetical protein